MKKELSHVAKLEILAIFEKVVMDIKKDIRQETTICKILSHKFKNNISALEYLQENRPSMSKHGSFFIHALYSPHRYIWWQTGDQSKRSYIEKRAQVERCNEQRVKFLEHLIEQLISK